MTDTPAPTFSIGDRVTVHTQQGGPQTVSTVARFIHDRRGLELADGSQWRADGKRQWGFRGGFYKGPWVEPATEGDEDHVAKRRTIGRIRKFADTLTMESPYSAAALRRILEVIDGEAPKEA
jgi:hypothetical protein